MKQIRCNVFETNSSSTHSIAISKTPVLADGCHIHFYIGEYGWENDCVDTANYLYTAILLMEDSEDLLEKLKAILDRHQISYEFEEPEYSEGGWLEGGYIDHSYETREFIDAVLADDDMLLRCLFGNSYVYTGNDNSSDRMDMCYCAKETVYQSEWINGRYVSELIPNPNHDKTKYDYFFKGN